MSQKIIYFQTPFNSVETREGVLRITWMASTPQIDRYNSIVTVDAIRNGMSNYLKNPLILLKHDMDKELGLMVDHSITSLWLEITAEIMYDIDWVVQKIKDEVIKGFSIGFYPKAWIYKTKNGTPLSQLTQSEVDALDYNDIIREITELDLVEISVCSIPANPGAVFSLTRSLKKFFDNLDKKALHKRSIDGDVIDSDEETTTTSEEESQEIVAISETVENADNSDETTTEEVTTTEATETEERTTTETETTEVVSEAETVDENKSVATQENNNNNWDEVGEDVEITTVETTDATGDENPQNDTTASVAKEESVEELRAYIAQLEEVANKQDIAITNLKAKNIQLVEKLNNIPAKRGLVAYSGSQEKKDYSLKSQLAEAKNKVVG